MDDAEEITSLLRTVQDLVREEELHHADEIELILLSARILDRYRRNAKAPKCSSCGARYNQLPLRLVPYVEELLCSVCYIWAAKRLGWYPYAWATFTPVPYLSSG